MCNLNFELVAFDAALFHAWNRRFIDVPNVLVSEGDILMREADAIVSPANSFGYMDGGLDLKYSQHFGWDVEKRLRRKLERDHFGEIPVGCAVIVPITEGAVQFLVSAPTMRVPMDVSKTANAYLAFKAVIQSIMRHNQGSEEKIESVLCPGLGTGEGKMAADQCAIQMRMAFDVCCNDAMPRNGGLVGAVTQHMQLVGSEE